MARLIVLPMAEQDIKHSVEWYNEQRIGLGADFVRVLDDTFSSLSQHPLAFPLVKLEIRKYVLKDFPYNIFYVYKDKEDTVYVLAVFHVKRNPNVWKKRKIRK